MNALAEPVAPRVIDIHRPAIDGAMHLPLTLLAPSPTNPRKHFDQAALQDLADSIKVHGLLQPILVRAIDGAPPGRPQFEIVAGERRWRACQLAGLGSIMALVRPLSDFEVLEVQLVENLKRTDLTELEEAEGYRQLLRKPDGLQGYASVDELAARIGKSRSYVFQRMKLLDLAEPGRQALADGRIAFSVALLIARLKPEDQATATKEIVRGWGGEPLTYKAAADYIHRTFHLELDRAVFKITDATLVPAAGSCRDCAKRTGANPDLFQDVKKADTCTDAACFHAKEDAHRARLKAEAEARGMDVITGAAAKKIKPNDYGSPKGYLELDKTHHTISSDKPLRKLLAKADVKPVLVEDPHTKDLVEMVPEKEALAALKASGVLKQAKMPSTMASQRAADVKREREMAWRKAVADAVLQAAGGSAGAEPGYRQHLIQLVAQQLWGELQADTRTRITKLLGWPPLKGRWSDGPGRTADDHIATLSDAELARYLTCTVIASQVHVGSYEAITKPERLLAMADLLGVDVAAAKASVAKVSKTTPDATLADRKRKAAAQLTPETALAAAVKAARPLKMSVRYRCPGTGSTWAGRGLQPAWLKVAIARGAKLADFAVDPAAAAKGTPKPAASTLSAAAADPFRTDKE